MRCVTSPTVAGQHSQFSDGTFEAVTYRSLTSAKNWGSNITLVTPKSDQGCAKIADSMPHVHVHVIDVAVHEHGSWVQHDTSSPGGVHAREAK